MKNIKKKILSKLLIAITVVILFFNLISPSVVQADVGGVLFWPVQQLVELLGDSIMWLMQSIFTYTNDSVTHDLVFSTGYDIPNFNISPELIFSNEIAAFDVNFIRPKVSYRYNYIRLDTEYNFANALANEEIDFEGENGQKYKEKAMEILRKILLADDQTSVLVIDKVTPEDLMAKLYGNDGDYAQNFINLFENERYKFSDMDTWKVSGYSQTVGEYLDYVRVNGLDIDNHDELVKVGYYLQTLANHMNTWSEENFEIPEDFTVLDDSHQLGLTLVNLIDRYGEGHLIKTGFENIRDENSKTEEITAAKKLQPVISYWYNTLRNIAIVGMLLILVYIGIRIVISTVASDKSKFKELLKDWFIAFCILMFMHYLMSGMIELTQNISEKIIPSVGQDYYSAEVDGNTIEYNGDKYLGLTRIKMQSSEFSDKIVYTIIYAVFVIYTLIFALMYLKRVIYLAFLTMVAPLVAFTYPIDKMRDGSAQAFNMWFKEYMFNILIQPFHLVLYYIIIGATFNLIDDNPIYALVALGFLIPAERILRKFFGFDKSSESNALGGMLSGALVMQGINRLRGKAEASGRGSNGKEKDNKQIRTADSGNNTGSLMSDIAGNNEGETSSGQDDEGQQLNESEKYNPYNTYFAQGYGQNANGEYYNPYTDEYDPEYDPAKDVNNYKYINSEPSPYEKYEADGYGKNDRGEYYNPYIDEYDKDYDPALDKNYRGRITPYDVYNQDGYGQNANGEYFNPYTDEYDKNYDPNNDINYWKKVRNLEIARKYSEEKAKKKNGKVKENRKINVGTPVPRRIREVVPEISKEELAKQKAKEAADLKEKDRKVKALIGARMLKGAAKFTGKGILKAYGAATVGTIGVAAGLASEKYSNVATYGIAGGLAGKALANATMKIPSKIKGTVDNAVDYYEDARDEAEKEVYTDRERKDAINERLDDKFLRDKEAIKMYKDEFGELGYKDAMNDALEYRKYGITDNKTIIKAMKLKTKGLGDRANKRRILVAKTANQLNRKDVDHFGERLRFNKFTQNETENLKQAIRDFNDWE